MARTQSSLTHLDPDGRPAMVDVSGKPASVREAPDQIVPCSGVYT